MAANDDTAVPGPDGQPGLDDRKKKVTGEMRRVLCIEDEPDIRKLLSISLNCRGRYEVVTAENGEVGLEKAKKRRFDCILLDALMPVMDGYETCKRLKGDPQTRDIPVIFLAAKTQQKEIEKGMALGALDYLVKPFDPLTLPDQIEEILCRLTRGAEQ